MASEGAEGESSSRGEAGDDDGVVVAAVDRAPSTSAPDPIAEIMHAAIAHKVFPGGAVAWGRLSPEGNLVRGRSRAYGTHTFESNVPVDARSIFDVASLTKVVVTSVAVLVLRDRGLIGLDDHVCEHLPDFAARGKDVVTIRHLLTHSGGLRAWYNFKGLGLETKEAILDFVCGVDLEYAPGEDYRYSDLSMIALGAVVERISGQALEDFARENVFDPLGMASTGFRPIADPQPSPQGEGVEEGEREEEGEGSLSQEEQLRVVPTEFDTSARHRLLWGEVHDLNAFLMGGVAGHAGLFSTCEDLASFCRFILLRGLSPTTGARLFSPEAAEVFLSRLSETSPYGFGWNLYADPPPKADPENESCGQEERTPDPPAAPAQRYRSGGAHLSPESVGHTGFTGTSIWIDPSAGNMFYVVLLTNALHPDATSKSGCEIRDVRPRVADAAFRLAFPERFEAVGEGGEGLAGAGAKVASVSSSTARKLGLVRWRHVRDVAAFLTVCLWSVF